MAVIWQKTIEGIHYEIRGAGRTRRLYTNGVFHSQHNPKKLLTGGIWDLLMLPALFHPPESIRRVLVLGVGGGAVIRLLSTFIAPTTIVGIELNKQHIHLARRFFGVRAKAATLVHADAVLWLNEYSGPPFDMIIDDLFGEDGSEPVRAVALDEKWFALLDRNLSEHGVLVINTVSKNELNHCAYRSSRRISRQFASAFALSLPTYANTIAAFFKTAVSKNALKTCIDAWPEKAQKNAIVNLPFRLRRLRPH